MASANQYGNPMYDAKAQADLEELVTSHAVLVKRIAHH